MITKAIKRIIILTILILLGIINNSYAGVTVSTSSVELTEGETKSVSITATGGGGNISVSSSNPSVVEAKLNSSEGWIENETLSINIKGVKAGTTTINVTGTFADDSDEPKDTPISKTINVTVKEKATQSETSENNNSSSSSNNKPAATEEEEKSSNANLASLTIGSGTLTPRFSKSTTTYAVTLEDDVTSLTVNAKAEDSKATVDISGNTNLKEGRNPITILVTAEDGTTKTYTINAIKDGTQEEEEEEEETTSSYVKLGLESLSIEGVTLDPKFDPSTYTYNVTIKDDSITSLNVNAVATDENATVEIVGNENLQPGENIVTIIITSENGEDIRVYQIFVTKTTEEVAEVPKENNNMQMWYIIGGSVAGVLILLIIILIVVKKKKSKKLPENKSNKKEESVEIEIENKPVEKKKKTNKKSDKGKH